MTSDEGKMMFVRGSKVVESEVETPAMQCGSMPCKAKRRGPGEA